MKKLIIVLSLLVIAASGQSQDKKTKSTKRSVPIYVNVSTVSGAAIVNHDLPLYTVELIEELNKALNVKLFLVEEKNNPEVVLNLEIADFKIGPRDQTTSIKSTPRSQVVGKGASGENISQTVNAVTEYTTVERESEAVFSFTLKMSQDPDYQSGDTFNSKYIYKVTNVVGEPVLKGTMPMRNKKVSEPADRDYLILLSKQEMVGKLSTELRKYYQIKTAQLN